MHYHALIFLLFLSPSFATSSSRTELEATWRREYPRAAEEWEAAMRSFVAKGKYSLRFFSGSLVQVGKLTVASSADKMLLTSDDVVVTKSGKQTASTGDTTVRCETSDYLFDLTKTPPATTYLIEEYDRPRDHPASLKADFDGFARGATTYSGRTLLERMRHPSFVLEAIESIPQDGESLVRIRYSCRFESRQESGQVTLDPKRNWAIRKVAAQYVDTSSDRKGSYEINVNYTTTNNAPFFNRVERIVRPHGSDAYQRTILELDEITLGDVPDSIFRLSAYGLPDVPLRPSPRASVFTFRNPVLWLTGAGALASFALMWYLRPRRAQPA